ncbi:MAG: hypothetical protein ACM3PF_10340 [Bacteroidota bacterium]
MRISLALAIVLTAPLVVAVPARAHGSSQPPDSMGRDCASSVSEEDWHVRLGEAFRDTLDAPPSVASWAAMAALQSDKWVQDPTEVTRVLTEWKPIHHILFRLFSGKAFGRIFIDVRPLAGQRSEVQFQGVLATHRDIDHNPARFMAERSYASAVRQWQREVREWIARRVDP